MVDVNILRMGSRPTATGPPDPGDVKLCLFLSVLIHRWFSLVDRRTLFKSYMDSRIDATTICLTKIQVKENKC
jgi:hypothetical protein